MNSMSAIFDIPEIKLHSTSGKAGKKGKSGKKELPQHTLWLLTPESDLDPKVGKKIPTHLKEHGALKGDKGSKLAIHESDASHFFFGLGPAKKITPQEAAEWGENAGHFILAEEASEIVIEFTKELDDSAIVLNFIKGLSLSPLRYFDLKSKAPKKIPAIKVIVASGDSKALPTQDDLKELEAIVSGIAIARVLGELPSSIATPQGVIDLFEMVTDPKKLDLEVWDENKIRKEKMGLLLAVAQGSAIPPRFLIARPKQKKKDAKGAKKNKKKAIKLFLVGKGIVFDTGGINLKTTGWQDLLWMKKDMCGAAGVLGAILAISEMNLPIEVIAITPLTFNSIGSRAVIPGDIVKSYAGKTVEIQNTDAEGRLILADAVHYAVTQNATHIVDVATLTGACLIALGHQYTGLMTNNESFSEKVLEASLRSGEPAWPLPLSDRHGEELKSVLADLKNMGSGREAGASIGGKFIEQFVSDTPWCHLDIAGSADLGAPAAAGAQIKAAGRTVHTLVELAKDLSQSQS